MDNLKSVYDDIYTVNQDYNFHYPAKDLVVDLYANEVCGTILDAGCGQGGNLKRLLDQGVDAFGVELSSVCCDKYLSNVPHENSDIISFATKYDKLYDGVICFDVLEHIPESDLDKNIQSLAKMSSSALLGIANHSDIQNGKELHLIQENENWWVQRLLKFYKSANCVVSYLNDTFFVIEVSNLSAGNLKLDEKYNRLFMFAHEYDKQWICSSELTVLNQNLKNVNSDLEEKNKSLEEKNKSLEEKNKSLEEKNKSLEEKNKSLEEKNQNLSVKYELLNNKFINLESEHKELRQMYSVITMSRVLRTINVIRKLIGLPTWKTLD